MPKTHNDLHAGHREKNEELVMAAVRSIQSHPGADSYWEVSATPLAPYPSLQPATHWDVIVVGAGYTGLSAALHLAQTGASVCVLDAHQPGWGASGRNGGQVNPTLKHDPDDLTRLLGKKAEPLIEVIATSADVVFSLIEQHKIQCQPVRSGWLQVSHQEKDIDAFSSRVKQWEGRGYPAEILDRTALERRTGSKVFRSGWLDKRAGSVQPLSYARGLARAAVKAGATIYGDSPVSGLQRTGQRWVVNTTQGIDASADQIVLATNAYSDGLWPGAATSILSANSFIASTTPLGARAAHILPSGETLSTAQRLLIYLRKESDGRILIGGRGLFRDPSSPEDFSHIERGVKKLYPELAPLQFDYRWAGRVAITRDSLPHVHRPAPGITIAFGYNGRGVAAATAMGRTVAQLLREENEHNFPFPITRVSQIPLHGVLQRFYISAGVAWYGLLDRLSR